MGGERLGQDGRQAPSSTQARVWAPSAGRGAACLPQRSRRVGAQRRLTEKEATGFEIWIQVQVRGQADSHPLLVPRTNA